MSDDAKQLVAQLQRNPADGSLFRRAREALLQERRYKSFVKVMRWWAKRAPSPAAGAQALFEAGEVTQKKLRDDALATELFEAALELDPAHTGATSALAKLRGDTEFADLLDGFDDESVPPPARSSYPPGRKSSRAPAPGRTDDIRPPSKRPRSVPPPAAAALQPPPASAFGSPGKLPASRVPSPRATGSSFFPSTPKAEPTAQPAAAASAPQPVPAPAAAPPAAAAPAAPSTPVPPRSSAPPLPAVNEPRVSYPPEQKTQPLSASDLAPPSLPAVPEEELTGRFASDPAPVEVAPAGGVPSAAGLQPPPDGFEPQLYDDEDDEPVDDLRAPAVFPVDRIMGDGTAAATGASGPVRLEVVRRRGDTVLGNASVRLMGRAGSAALRVRRAGGSAFAIQLSEGASGHVRRGATGAREPLGSGDKFRLEAGDVADVEHFGVTHQLGVVRDAPPPLRAPAPVPLKRHAGAIGGAFAIHLLGLALIASLSTMGVTFKVEDRSREEIFAEARMKPPEERPKPKLKKPKPVKLRKRRKQPPKPPETEAKAKIPKSLRKRLRKIAKTRNASANSGNAVDRLVTALKSPVSGEGQTLKEVVSNIDAVKGGEKSGAFRIGGTLAALEGGSPNIVSSGGGEVGTLGGQAATGKLTRLEGKKGGGGVRGKVSTIKALAKVQGSLSRGEVQKVINEHQHKMQRCYERALNAKPSLAGKLTYSWTIKPNGRVGAVRNAGNTMGDTGVAKCIAGVIKRMRFPRPKGGSVEITYPFIFKRAM